MTHTPVRSVPAGTEPTTVGRYRLCFEIASGGMATVFLARAEGPSGFEKLVALKRIHPQLAKDVSILGMFLDEARIASRISHANVCAVFDYGSEDGTSFIAMEYLTGEPISRIVRAVRGASPAIQRAWPRIAARVTADLCEGLHSAHELRDERNEPLHVVHRDISPDNLFVTYDGIAKVVDFGIASARHRIHQTMTGELKGKHSYMAPEQLTEAPIDRRADIWALGVVLWECLTQQRLFHRRSSAETLFAVVSAPIRAPSGVRPDLPSDLDRIVLRCLERDPDARYRDARELGRDLTRWLGKQTESVGLADVADWMTQLVPGEADRRRQLVELARAPRGDAGIPRIGGMGDPSSESSTIKSEVRAARRGWRPPAALAIALGCVVGLSIGLASTGLFTGGARMEDPRADDPGPATTPQARSVLGDEVSSSAPMPATPAVVEPEPTVEAGPSEDRSHETDTVEPRPPAQRGHGWVAIATPGSWALVLERGRRLGQAPGRFRMRSGRHVLEVRHLGRAPGKRVVVRIEPGETARVVVEPGG